MSFDLKVSTLIVGDSFIWRFLKYVDEESGKDVLGKIDRLLNLYREDVNIEFKGKSGGCFEDLRAITLENLVKEKYDVLILMVGGNDIDGNKRNPDMLSNEVSEFTENLIEAELIKYAVITQIIPRDNPRHMSKEVYRAKADKYNLNMERVASLHTRILYWRHIRLGQRRILSDDGIHLNQTGNYMLYHSLKKALAHVIGHLDKGEDCRCSAANDHKRPRAGKKHQKR